MALSIRNIINQINESLAEKFKGSKFYGVAISVDKEGVLQPVANEMPVTYDDTYSLQVYHKLNGVNITYKPGMGRLNNTINTFQVSAYLFNNEKRTGLKSDEIAMIMQSVLSLINIESVRILPVNIILNTQAIFNAEYRGVGFRFSEYQSLMQFNYNIEITFKSGCFDLCPEDFSQCKIN